MDPLTILSGAAAVSAVVGKSWELAHFIRDLCQGIKTVDERIRRLESGVTELAGACQSVRAVLERTQPGSSSTTPTPNWDEDGSSATSIDREVSSCNKTLDELKQVLADLVSGSSSRISRHMKMQDGEKHIIDGLSARIKTHTDAIQLSLQIVTIKITLATPDFLLKPLNEALQDISARLARMEPKERRSRGRNSPKEDNEDPLIGLAQDALQRGTALYNASVAGSSIVPRSATSSEKSVSVRRWIHETDDAAQNAHAPRDDRSRPALDEDDMGTSSMHSPIGSAVANSPSPAETASDAGAYSRGDLRWDDNDDRRWDEFESLPAPETRPAPTSERSDLRGRPTDSSKPLDQWNRSDIVSRFNIKPVGQLDIMICTSTNVDLGRFLRLENSESFVESDAGGYLAALRRKDLYYANLARRRATLALHLAVLFRDIYLIEPLITAGYSPNLPLPVSDREPFRDLRTPIDIAVASRSEPITEALLMRGTKLNLIGGASPCLQLFATASLNLWPSPDEHAYTGMIKLLLDCDSHNVVLGSHRRTTRDSWTKSLLHQICDVPKTSSDLRLPLIIYALEQYGRGWPNPSAYCSPLHVAIQLYDLKTLEFVLEASDVHHVNYYLQCGIEDRKTPLRYAIEEVVAKLWHSLDIVEALLKRGASLEETSKAPSRYLGGFFQTKTSLRTTAMRSNRPDLRELVAKY
jgi:hypothetical protein